MRKTPKEVLESLIKDGLVSGDEIASLTDLLNRISYADISTDKKCFACKSPVIYNSKFCFNCGVKFSITSGEIDCINYIHEHYPRLECDHCHMARDRRCSYSHRVYSSKAICMDPTNREFTIDKLAMLDFVKSELDQYPDLAQFLTDRRIRIWK